MKKNGLTTAVIAGIAGVAGVGSIADAVNLNPDGLGQVLLYPYYTTSGGNDTLMSIVNTAPVGKAVKVRFLEGRNSREVLDFHLYLSRFDVWTAAIASSAAAGVADEGAGLVTTDLSCTVPDIARGGLGYDPDGLIAQLADGRYFVSFVNYAFSGDFADADEFAEGNPDPGSLERSREGYIEVIEMADIVQGSTLNGWIQHVNGAPTGCQQVNSAWFGPGNQFIDDPGFGLESPDGQGELFGNAMIVNPARGTVTGYPADAIEGFNYVNLHFPPGDTDPGLDAVNNELDGNATAFVFRFGGLITATYDSVPQFGRVDAVTALYTSPRVINEYYLDTGGVVTGTSEWVINFPTKRYYVDTNPSLPAGANFATAVRAPFNDAFDDDGACQDVSIVIYDREERTAQQQGGGFSPRPPGARPNALCWEAQVITFNQAEEFTAGEPSNILGSTYFKNLQTTYRNGWAAVNFINNPPMRASAEGVVFSGLPVTGFFATNYDNSELNNGVLANYSSLFRHRTERVCSGVDACS